MGKCLHFFHAGQIAIELEFKPTIGPLDSAVPTPRTPRGQGVGDVPAQILENVRNVSNGLAMGDEIPSPSSVSTVVEPRSED
jgi:hypothetical protein